MTATCPCCGAPVAPDADLVWNLAARTLTGRGHTITFTERQAIVFEVLWANVKRRRVLSRTQFAAAVYADRFDGGPVSAENCMSIVLWQIRPLLALVGLSVPRAKRSWGGYVLDGVVRPAAPARRAA